MTGDHDGDLRAAFEQLHAPRSTSRYAIRGARSDRGAPEPLGQRRWVRIAAASVVVLVAVAGAATFVGLRNARQPAPATAAGPIPPARASAAIAYDSVGAETVMFGGRGTDGGILADTWAWDGTAWRAVGGGSPPALQGAQMADDPVDGGVLLIGEAAPDGAGVPGGAGVACSGSASASAASSSPAASPPGGAAAGPPVTPDPAATAPVPGPVPDCGRVAPVPEQTWILNARGWHQAAAGTPPPPGVAMARVPGSGQVVAVASTGGLSVCSAVPRCEVPDAAAVPAPGVCQLTESGGCAAFSGSIRTWLWQDGRWTETPVTLNGTGSTAQLVPTADGNGLELLSERFSVGYFCNNLAGGCPVTLPSGAGAWRWTGQEWQPDSSGVSFPPANAEMIASNSGRALLVTASGQTWEGPSGGWNEVQAHSAPGPRSGEALAADRNGGFVLFGGYISAGALGTSLPGSDTWLWESGAWRHISGIAPSPQPLPTACPVAGGASPCGVEIQPAQVPPARPAATAPNPCFQQDCLP